MVSSLVLEERQFSQSFAPLKFYPTAKRLVVFILIRCDTKRTFLRIFETAVSLISTNCCFTVLDGTIGISSHSAHLQFIQVTVELQKPLEQGDEIRRCSFVCMSARLHDTFLIQKRL
jgi:hypothetical protein